MNSGASGYEKLAWKQEDAEGIYFSTLLYVGWTATGHRRDD